MAKRYDLEVTLVSGTWLDHGGHLASRCLEKQASALSPRGRSRTVNALRTRA